MKNVESKIVCNGETVERERVFTAAILIRKSEEGSLAYCTAGDVLQRVSTDQVPLLGCFQEQNYLCNCGSVVDIEHMTVFWVLTLEDCGFTLVFRETCFSHVQGDRIMSR
jgi:hypothetical protein